MMEDLLRHELLRGLVCQRDYILYVHMSNNPEKCNSLQILLQSANIACSCDNCIGKGNKSRCLKYWLN